MSTRRGWVVCALLAPLVGCSSTAGSYSTPDPAAPAATAATAAADAPSAEVVEVQPGGPGEPSSTAVVLPEERWNHDDLAFVQMMLVHHRQALDLAALAPARAADPRVRALAGRIEAAQAPEILVMASWLRARGVDVPQPGEDPRQYDHAEHGHRGMVGMLGPEQLQALEQARGAGFDRLFLEGMIEHHLGAVAMAADVRRHGTSLRVGELAQDVEAGQAAEVTRMEALLASPA
ncbi:DUF305 domain-containing protein [Nocardioides sp. SYSU DS0663]|uniref:DUF305 domain-containing protein n=1 Tax=Nocardioides sp. SYSU DS0663 TaxID=3416445 RepID=UPI003F4C8B85